MAGQWRASEGPGLRQGGEEDLGNLYTCALLCLFCQGAITVIGHFFWGHNVQELAISKATIPLLRRLAYVVRVHLWLLLFVATYFVAALVAAAMTSRPLVFPSGYLASLCAVLGVLVPWCIAGYAAYTVWRHRPDKPLAFVAGQLAQRVFTVERLSGSVLAFVLLIVHATAFSCFKCLIPEIQPYAWDDRLASWDRALHGGTHPWEYVQHAAGYPWFTRWIDVCYISWAVVIQFGILGFVIGSCQSRRRMHVLLANVVSWTLLGNVVATLFSSAGPCYYNRVASGSDPYTPLMHYLSEVDEAYAMYAIGVQEWLWEGFAGKQTSLGYGISAMPSMHVGAVFLLVLATWRMARWLRYFALLYLGVIFVGSIHLGWHYALDGYVAVAGVGAIWWAVGRLLARDPAFDPPGADWGDSCGTRQYSI